MGVILGNIYVKPLIDFSPFLEKLQSLLDKIESAYGNDLIIIGGDFNSRVGSGDSLHPDLLDDSILFPDARSSDVYICPRGKMLIDFMASNEFILLNGRTPGDRPANWTYLSHLGTSVIDLVFVKASHIDLIADLKVDSSIPFSDHFPVSLLLRDPYSPPSCLANTPPTPRNTLINSYAAPTPKWKPSDPYVVLAFKQSFSANFNNSFSLTQNSPDQLNYQIQNAIFNAASQSGLLQSHRPPFPTHGRANNTQSWSGVPEIRQKRSEVTKTYKNFKKNKYCKNSHLAYHDARKEYKSMVKYQRKLTRINLTVALNNATDSKNFWVTLKKVRPKTSNHCPVPTETWNQFYSNIYPPRDFPFFIPTLNVVPELESFVTMEELDLTLSKLKANKATGPDLISNEFYRALPLVGKEALLHLFNSIITTETCPDSWSDVIVTMIFKKGVQTDPKNYRGIALVNHITKLFTYILKNRLEKWVIAHNILPGSQFGFREGIGCTEAIFTLFAAIQLQLRLDKREVYAVFVDFCRAFDSVPHDPLRAKLNNMGISSKWIRIVKSLYDKA